MSFDRNRIRIALELTTPLIGSLDFFTGRSPQMSAGRTMQFEFALFSGGALDPLTSITSLKVEVKAMVNGVTTIGSAALMSKTQGSFNAGLTLAAWQGGQPVDCHAIVQFSELETGLATGSLNYTDYALIVTGQTTVGPVDLGTAVLRVIATGGLTIATPPVLGDPTYVRTDDYKADQQGVIKLKNAAGFDIILLNNLGYGVHLYPTPGTTTPNLEIDIVAPPT